jgi:SAM-dependent methyltransferase
MQSIQAAIDKLDSGAKLLVPERLDQVYSARVLVDLLEAEPGCLEELMRAAYANTGSAVLSDEEGKRAAERLKRYIFSGDTVLELGCGTGIILKHLADEGQYLYGADVSERKLALAALWLQGFSNVELLHCSADRPLALENGGVDFAFSLSAFHRMAKSNAFRVLKGLFRVLRNGGRALLSFPNLHSESFFREYIQDALVPRPEGGDFGLRLYTKDEVRKLVEALGYCVSELWTDEGIHAHLKKVPEVFPDRLVMGRNETAVLDLFGWYGLEKDREGGICRWTRKRASFFLNLDPSRSALRVDCTCLHPAVDRMGLCLTLFQEGKEVSRAKIHSEGRHELTFRVEPSGRDEIVHFTLEADWTFVSMEEGALEGSRELGVAVSSIKTV